MEALSQMKLSLSSDLLVELFPFHIAFDRQLEIVQTGHCISRLYSSSLEGQRLDDCFVIKRPTVAPSFELIQQKQQLLFVLAAINYDLTLKGQMVELPDTGCVLFLCSPWGIEPRQLVDLGIRLKDFPLHDVTPDLIFLQRTTQMSVQQIEGLNRQVMASQRQLQDALKVQESLRFQAEQQAMQLERQLKELKETQIQLVQAEKMSALGQLLSGIFHEINNPLHCIHGNLDHCMEYVKELTQFCKVLVAQLGLADQFPKLNSYDTGQFADMSDSLSADDYESLAFALEDFPQVIKAMRAGSDRIREIVKGLRSFSRLDAASLDEFDVHEGIENTLMILKHRFTKANLSKPLQIVKNYAAVPRIHCYAGQINQVLMNILANAIEALEDANQSQNCWEHSVVRLPQAPVALVDTRFNQPTIWIQTSLNDRGWLQIKIRDNAGGMPEAVKSKIFEPFFTTKSRSRGTGLGMSISYQIVTERHGGCLSCESQPGIGTEFTIELPIATNPLPVGKIHGEITARRYEILPEVESA